MFTRDSCCCQTRAIYFELVSLTLSLGLKTLTEEVFVLLRVYQRGCSVSTTLQNLPVLVLCCQTAKSLMIVCLLIFYHNLLFKSFPK